MQRRKIYFGHPVNSYNTELEKILLSRIGLIFPGCDIVNPNSPEHERGYQERKASTGNGMDYFLKEVLPSCHCGVFLPFRDGKLGQGVYKEALQLSESGKSVFEISVKEEFFTLDLTETSRVLSVEETRARIRDVDGNLLPY